MWGKTEAPAADGCKSPMTTEGRSRPWDIIACLSSSASSSADLIMATVQVHKPYALYKIFCCKLTNEECRSAECSQG